MLGYKKRSNLSAGRSLLEASGGAMSLLLCLLPALLLLHLVAGHSQPRPQVQEEGGQDRQESHVTKIKLKQVHILRLESHILHLISYIFYLTYFIFYLTSHILHLTSDILYHHSYIISFTPKILYLTIYILNITS